jgi:hypothetical protein
MTQQRPSGSFIIEEAAFNQSRDTVTFVNAGTADIQVVAGTVLASAAEGADAVIAPAGAGSLGANTGNGTLGPLTFGPQVKPGTYTVKFTSPTVFTLTDPAGELLTLAGAAGTAFSNGQIGLTLTASTTPFIAGDGFTITVPDYAARAAVLAGVTVALGGGDAGNGSLGSLTWGNVFKAGAYRITFSSATAFTVADPSGPALGALGSGAVGTLFASAELGFLITAGTTPFVNGDTITITVPPFEDHVVNWVNAAPASAVAYNSCWVRAGQFRSIPAIRRKAEVKLAELVFDPSIAPSLYATAAAELATLGIIAR